MEEVSIAPEHRMRDWAQGEFGALIELVSQVSVVKEEGVAGRDDAKRKMVGDAKQKSRVSL